MKNIVEFNEEIGSDGLKVGGGVDVDGENLQLSVGFTYPIAKIIEPATSAIDNLIDKLEETIPGSWDAPLLEKVKTEYKEELIKLLTA